MIEGEDNVILRSKNECGNIQSKLETIDHYTVKQGRLVDFTFTPDDLIFKNLNLDYQYFLNFFEEQSYLTPSIIDVEDLNLGLSNVRFFNRNGMSDLADLFIHKLKQESKIRVDETFKINNFSIHWTICFMPYPIWENINIKAWANHESIYGGSLHQGLKKGLYQLLFLERLNKEYLNCFMIFVQIKGKGFLYVGSLKNQLDMPELEQKIIDYIINNSKISSLILNI